MRKSKQIIIKLKNKKNKAQYNLDKQTAKVSASTTENVFKYVFLTVENVLFEKVLLEKLLQSSDRNIHH